LRQKFLEVLIVFNVEDGQLLHGNLNFYEIKNKFKNRVNLQLLFCGSNVSKYLDNSHLDFYGDVFVIEDESLPWNNPYILAQNISSLSEKNFDVVILPHSIANCGAAAFLAAQFSMECFTAINDFYFDDETLVLEREVFGGFTERILCKLNCIITWLCTYSEPCNNLNGAKYNLIKKTPVECEDLCSVISVEKAQSFSRLSEANVLIAVGRGIGSLENIELAQELALLFDNSSIAASRPVCDNRWLPYKYQVGVTGKTVPPALYFSLGISGSSQHLLGMKNSRCIVSVNKDRYAAISSIADYIVEDDIFVFIPAFIHKVKEKKKILRSR